MSDPYDESPPWNLPWPDNPIPPAHAAPHPEAASATLTAFTYAPPPIPPLPALDSPTPMDSTEYSGDDRLRLAGQLRISLVKRKLGEKYWGMGRVGMWVAERLGQVAGWTQASETSAPVDSVDTANSRAGVASATIQVANETPGLDEEELPVDANFYFFLVVCKLVNVRNRSGRG